MRERLLLIAVLFFPFTAGLAAAPDSAEIRVLIIDGQDNQQWQLTTPVLKNILGNTGRFVVNIMTTPSKGVAASDFSPDLDSYDVVLSNYNGEDLTGWKQVNGTAQYKVLGDEGVLVGTTAKGSPNPFLATEQEFGDFELKFEAKLDNPKLNSGVQIRSHQYYIRCRGDRIETWINGVKIADLQDDMDRRGGIMLQVHAIPGDKGPWSVRWRNTQIRELDSD